MKIDWNTTSVRIRSAGRIRCEVGWELTPQWSKNLRDFDFWFVWAGRGVMQTHLGEVALRPGIGFWMRPGGTYVAQQSLEDRLGVAFIHFDLLDRDGQVRPYDATLPPLVNDLDDVNLYDSATHRVVDLMRMKTQSAQQVAAILFKGVLADLDARAEQEAALPAGTRRHYHKLVNQWASRITESPHEIPPIAEIASEAGYCADHFARVFKSVLGQSPQAFTVQAKISRARQLLAETELTISQIAEALGYEDVYFFSRQFKQKVGVPPTQFRARASQG